MTVSLTPDLSSVIAAAHEAGRRSREGEISALRNCQSEAMSRYTIETNSLGAKVGRLEAELSEARAALGKAEKVRREVAEANSDEPGRCDVPDEDPSEGGGVHDEHDQAEPWEKVNGVERLTPEELAIGRQLCDAETGDGDRWESWLIINGPTLLSAAERDLSRAEQERESGETIITNERYAEAHRFSPVGDEYRPSTRVGLHYVKWTKKRISRPQPEAMHNDRWSALMDYLDEEWRERSDHKPKKD